MCVYYTLIQYGWGGGGGGPSTTDINRECYVCKALDWTLFHFIVCRSHLSDEVCLLWWWSESVMRLYAHRTEWRQDILIDLNAGWNARWSTCCINYLFCWNLPYAWYGLWAMWAVHIVLCVCVRKMCKFVMKRAQWAHTLGPLLIVLDYPESSWLLSSNDSIIRFRCKCQANGVFCPIRFIKRAPWIVLRYAKWQWTVNNAVDNWIYGIFNWIIGGL